MSDIFYQPKSRMFSNDGAIGSGYKFYFYKTGTDTPITTYSNPGLSVANTNPVVADSYGYFNLIYVSDFSQVKVVVKDSNDNLIYTADPVNPAGSSSITLNDLGVRPTSYWGLTAGTASAYTLAANPTLPAYSNYNTFFVQFHVACNAAPTLNVDGLGALNLKKYTGQGTKVALQAGDVQASQRYICTNDGVDILILNPRSLPFNAGSAPILTIATGVVTITNASSIYIIDTEASSATDNLDTINGVNDGEIIILRCADSTRKVVLTTGVGNIYNPAGTTITLGHQTQSVVLRYDSTQAVWVILGQSVGQATILQIQKTETGAVATGTTDIPFDDTIPQITEGDQYMSLSIIPKNASSVLKIDVVGNWGQDVNEIMTVALFKTGTANALAAVATFPSATLSYSGTTTFTHYITSGDTSLQTYTVRAGGNTSVGGTITFNGVTGGRKFGGVMASSITITEYLSS